MARCSFPTTTTAFCIGSATGSDGCFGHPARLAAADREAGRRKAEVCTACHGPAGNSVNPAVPSIAGQPAQFVSTELFLFREGNRKDPQMSPIAAGLSNGDLNDLAEYFAAEKLAPRSEEHTSELQSHLNLVCRLLLEKKNNT